MFFTLLLIVQFIVAALLVTVILLQKSEGGGLTTGGRPSGLMSARGAADFLTRMTAILATAFVVLSIMLAVMAASRHSNRIDASRQKAPASTTLPGQTTPPVVGNGASVIPGATATPATGNSANPFGQ